MKQLLPRIRKQKNMGDVTLRNMLVSDLPILFQQQQDPEANYLAAFTAEDPTDKVAFMQHWKKVLQNSANFNQIILYQGQVAGYMAHFEQFDKPSVGYWLGKDYWGKGIATKALGQFVGLIEARPLHARVAADNIGSRRVLEKCGFVLDGRDSGFAATRHEEIEELIFVLNQ